MIGDSADSDEIGQGDKIEGYDCVVCDFELQFGPRPPSASIPSRGPPIANDIERARLAVRAGRARSRIWNAKSPLWAALRFGRRRLD